MRANTPIHQSVLLQETVEFLQPHSGGIYLDATFGGGGHSRAVLEASGPTGKVVALDRDPTVEPWAKDLLEEYPDRFSFEAFAYDQADQLKQRFDGILFDLGLSSDQLENSGRGFTFQGSEPLDMRFDPTSGARASDILMQSTRAQLEYIFREYAQDRYARRLAQKIAETRRAHPLRTTADFVALVGSKDPAVLAPLFQAVRIAVNRELNVLKEGLAIALSCLKEDGTLVVISFHSLEDRLVKQFFREHPFRLLTKKPVTASDQELRRNPRSRSAKLRAGRLVHTS